MVKTRTGNLALQPLIFFFFIFHCNCHGHLQNKMGIVHIQCLVRIDGSILAGFFLTFSFCVVPKSSGSFNTASVKPSSISVFKAHIPHQQALQFMQLFIIESSSLLLHVGAQTALVQLITLSQQCTVSFKNFHTIGGSCRHWWLFSSIYPYTVVSNQFRLQLLTIKLLL